MEQPKDEYTLTADELGLVKPIIDTVESLQKEAQVVLRAITRLRGLEGNWALAGNRLVKVNPTPNPPVHELQSVGAPDLNGKG
jgi:hypothetical protein